MTRRGTGALVFFSACFLSIGLFSTAAKADITWTVQPSTQISAITSIHVAAFDVFDPANTHPDPNSEGYVPPIEIRSIPQTDPGTSGDPALRHRP